MTDVQIQWRGLTLGGAAFSINTLTGWLDLPGASFEGQDSSGHGQVATPGVQAARLVVAGGLLAGYGGARDALITQFRAAMIPRAAFDDALDPLVVTAAGRTSTARAQLQQYSLSLDPRNWAAGSIPWSAQWRCPDPRVYGAEISATAALIAEVAGVTLPRTMPFTMTPKPLGGQVSIVNSGNDPEGSPTVIILTGPQPGNVGVINSTTGAVLKYGFPLGAADQLRIDTEAGGAFLNGEYRAPSSLGYVTADLRAAPGTNVYRALGIAGGGSPSITVLVEPASW